MPCLFLEADFVMAKEMNDPWYHRLTKEGLSCTHGH